MTEQTQSFHADERIEHDVHAGAAAGDTDTAPVGRETLDAIDRLLNAAPQADARSALDAISLRIANAYASLGPGGNGADAIPDAAVREGAEREALAQQEAQERAAAEETAWAEADGRLREADVARHLAQFLASHSFNVATSAMAEISALMTWRPDETEKVDQVAVRAARALADFRSQFAALVAAGPVDDGEQAQDHNDELGNRFVAALDALRELQRQISAQIALLESDLSNTPALIAMERVVAEHAVRAAVASRGLGLSLAAAGMVR